MPHKQVLRKPDLARVIASLRTDKFQGKFTRSFDQVFQFALP